MSGKNTPTLAVSATSAVPVPSPSASTVRNRPQGARRNWVPKLHVANPDNSDEDAPNKHSPSQPSPARGSLDRASPIPINSRTHCPTINGHISGRDSVSSAAPLSSSPRDSRTGHTPLPAIPSSATSSTYMSSSMPPPGGSSLANYGTPPLTSEVPRPMPPQPPAGSRRAYTTPTTDKPRYQFDNGRQAQSGHGRDAPASPTRALPPLPVKSVSMPWSSSQPAQPSMSTSHTSLGFVPPQPLPVPPAGPLPPGASPGPVPPVPPARVARSSLGESSSLLTPTPPPDGTRTRSGSLNQAATPVGVTPKVHIQVTGDNTQFTAVDITGTMSGEAIRELAFTHTRHRDDEFPSLSIFRTEIGHGPLTEALSPQQLLEMCLREGAGGNLKFLIVRTGSAQGAALGGGDALRRPGLPNIITDVAPPYSAHQRPPSNRNSNGTSTGNASEPMDRSRGSTVSVQEQDPGSYWSPVPPPEGTSSAPGPSPAVARPAFRQAASLNMQPVGQSSPAVFPDTEDSYPPTMAAGPSTRSYGNNFDAVWGDLDEVSRQVIRDSGQSLDGLQDADRDSIRFILEMILSEATTAVSKAAQEASDLNMAMRAQATERLEWEEERQQQRQEDEQTVTPAIYTRDQLQEEEERQRRQTAPSGWTPDVIEPTLPPLRQQTMPPLGTRRPSDNQMERMSYGRGPYHSPASPYASDVSYRPLHRASETHATLQQRPLPRPRRPSELQEHHPLHQRSNEALNQIHPGSSYTRHPAPRNPPFEAVAFPQPRPWAHVNSPMPTGSSSRPHSDTDSPGPYAVDSHPAIVSDGETMLPYVREDWTLPQASRANSSETQATMVPQTASRQASATENDQTVTAGQQDEWRRYEEILNRGTAVTGPDAAQLLEQTANGAGPSADDSLFYIPPAAQDPGDFRPEPIDLLDNLPNYFPQYEKDLDKPFIEPSATPPATPSPERMAERPAPDIPRTYNPVPVKPPVKQSGIQRTINAVQSRFNKSENRRSIRHVADLKRRTLQINKDKHRLQPDVAEVPTRMEQDTTLSPEVGTGSNLRRQSSMWDRKFVRITPGDTQEASSSKQYNWIQGKQIGQGGFGKVYFGFIINPGDDRSGAMAVKTVKIQPNDFLDETAQTQARAQHDALLSEIELLKNLHHKNIVEYLGYAETSDSSSNELCIFLEYVPGGTITSIYTRLKAPFSEQLSKNFTKQILEGLLYLHDANIWHRDLKGDNVLVDAQGVCKISDFGISKRTADAYDSASGTMLKGTIHFMAPEIMDLKLNGGASRGYSGKVDVWSLGCLMFEMYTAQKPYHGMNVMQIVMHFLESKGPEFPEGAEISDDARDFMYNKCLQMAPINRPVVAELLQHRYITEVDPNWTFEQSPEGIQIAALSKQTVQRSLQTIRTSV